MSTLLTTATGSSVDGRPTGPPEFAAWRTSVSIGASTDPQTLARAYLDESEGNAFAAMDGSDQISWLLGQVAAKDAVCNHLVNRSFAAFDPKRIAVDYDVEGRPSVRVQGARFSTRGVQVSIANKPTVGVAIAARVPPLSVKTGEVGPKKGIGIHVESVESRPPSFEETVLAPPERSLCDVSSDDRDTWLTRMWAVKEAAAKASDLGPRRRPKDFAVDAVEQNRLRCLGRWIGTEPLRTPGGEFIVAWTETP
ncbi:MAG: 4'-phosphopantetheinyl transferase superfamily protein [Acidimicrobiales bacterium]